MYDNNKRRKRLPGYLYGIEKSNCYKKIIWIFIDGQRFRQPILINQQMNINVCVHNPGIFETTQKYLDKI